MSALPDHYAVLGISRAATQAQIKSAYRRLIRQYHTDRFEARRIELRATGDRVGLAALEREIEVAKEHVQEINAAYAVLSDPAQRTSYDMRLTSRTTATHRVVHTPRPAPKPSPPRPAPTRKPSSARTTQTARTARPSAGAQSRTQTAASSRTAPGPAQGARRPAGSRATYGGVGSPDDADSYSPIDDEPDPRSKSARRPYTDYVSGTYPLPPPIWARWYVSAAIVAVVALGLLLLINAAGGGNASSVPTPDTIAFATLFSERTPTDAVTVIPGVVTPIIAAVTPDPTLPPVDTPTGTPASAGSLSDADAYLAAAGNLVAVGRYAEAITRYTSALALRSTPEIYYLRAQAYAGLADQDPGKMLAHTEDAISDLTTAITLDNRYADAFLLRGNLFYRLWHGSMQETWRLKALHDLQDYMAITGGAGGADVGKKIHELNSVRS